MQLKVRKSLSGQNGRYIHLELLFVPDIFSPLSDQCPKLVKSRCPHLRNLYLSDFVNCTDSDGMNIDILVGADFYFLIVTGRIVRGEISCNPDALESAIGMILSGPYNREASQNSSNNLTVTHVMKISSDTDLLNHTLKRFWEIESTGNDEETYLVD